MALGPFKPSLLPVYDLAFADADGPFVVRAHLSKTGEPTAAKLGLDIAASNLTALCHDPKAGSSRVKHGMVAGISPDWDGLSGTFRVQGQPDSGFVPVTRALGKTYYGVFEQLASSVDDGADWTTWTRRRFTADGLKTPTGGPSGSWQSGAVRLRFVKERGDEADDYAPVAAEAVALLGTLKVSDQLTHPLHGFFEVRGVTQEGDYERARLER